MNLVSIFPSFWFAKDPIGSQDTPDRQWALKHSSEEAPEDRRKCKPSCKKLTYI